jgi:hypothetical protein
MRITEGSNPKGTEPLDFPEKFLDRRIEGGVR